MAWEETAILKSKQMYSHLKKEEFTDDLFDFDG